jgi:hypothetical protein
MNDQHTINTSPLPASKVQKLSDTSLSSPVIVPTPSATSEPDGIALQDSYKMETSEDRVETQDVDESQKIEEQEIPVPTSPADSAKIDAAVEKKKKKTPGNKKAKQPAKKSKRTIVETSASETSDSDSDSESESSSEDEKQKRKRKQKLAAKRAAMKKKQKAKAKAKKHKSKTYDSTSDETDSSDSSNSDSEPIKSSKKSRRKVSKAKATKKKSKKVIASSDDSDSESSSSSSSESDSEEEVKKRKNLKRKIKKSKKVEVSSSDDSSADEQVLVPPPAVPLDSSTPESVIDSQVAHVETVLAGLKLKQTAASAAATATKLEKPVKKNTLEFKRVDQVYDMNIRDWKLVESNKDTNDEFDCVFTVRRRLNWEGKYQETQVDIKSKVLRNCLQEVLKECKSISLVEDAPQLDPHTLFHYYDEIKTYVKKELKPKLKRAKKSKEKKLRTQQIAQCKLLLQYLDEDYTSVRKALKPMLKAGTITYELVWALFKPNTIAFTPTYSNKDDPRCFKVDFSYEYESWLTQAKSLVVDGRYLEYDGKSFGLGDHQVQIAAFKGHKKITSLSAYPLKYHKDPEGIRKQLIQRGMKFVALQGMNYRLQKGIAYMKHKNSVVRFNINGRVMIDPAIFRRINPNYQLSYIKHDELSQDDVDDDDGDDSDDCGCSGGEDDDRETDKLRTVMWKDHKGKKWPIMLPQSVINQEAQDNPEVKMEADEEDTNSKRHVFTEEELLIASPVVLGFAFSEKYWLEFSLSGIEEIKWNAEAFDSLVLPDRIKQNLKGLVSSHRFNAAKTIDDVIQGKGKGLNVVLHGPPGVGKTLTGESIAEYLKCPLYAVSAGELGTNSKSLEQDLNRIMDITHSWGAILLLDEADVFLEARQPHDIHRNSLVSVFLRLTEYYQGILFLTTNRVETFDEAFQSRIHMGIRYENLQPKARKKIWQHHVGKVEAMADKSKAMKLFSDADFDELSKRNMNGRQVCVFQSPRNGFVLIRRCRSRTRSRQASRSRWRRKLRSAWSMSSACWRLRRRSRTI